MKWFPAMCELHHRTFSQFGMLPGCRTVNIALIYRGQHTTVEVSVCAEHKNYASKKHVNAGQQLVSAFNRIS
ncbi:hypothetical protein ACTL6P_01780 [Endozoicomonas acroporae]|uniref:hypothetical protein n=1 Tax=Endozoicomonas acroporae TaxID=1701104 RepID=UPI000C77E541|nr:hypothetical protein [Endozoicomonas acroporae]